MRIEQNVRLLRGAKRSAVYDYDRGLCWPATDEEVDILNRLSKGQPILSSPVSTKSLVAMRQKGWIRSGRPRRHDLSIRRTAHLLQPERLENVWLELTNSCNLTCQHCYASSGPDVDRSKEMSPTEWEEIIANLLTYTPNKITFIGGEPTIRIGLIEQLSRFITSRAPSVKIRMFSNLAIQNRVDEVIRIVNEYKIEFGTALYGIDPRGHDAMTGKVGSWKVTISAVERCLAEGVDVFVGMYIDTKGLQNLSIYEQWLRNKGIRRFEIIAPSKVGRGAKKDWKDESVENVLPHAMTFSSHQADVSTRGHNCFSDHIMIGPSGQVSPCIMTRDVIYGDAKNGVEKIFETDKYRNMSALSKDEIDGCSDCEFRYACFDCRPDAMQGTDDWRRKPDCGYDPREDITLTRPR